MEPIIIIVAVVVLLSVLYYSFVKKERQAGPNKESSWPAHQPPQKLGIFAGHMAYDAALRLEESIPAGYEERIKERMQQQDTTLTDREWQWRWHELKRFLLMGALLRRVNMYSAQVDEVWHEMLMFTREYQEFCERFCGRMIHHAPHSSAVETAGKLQEPGAERAWFDWVYGELFGPDNPGSRLWGAMYRTPMSPALLELLGQDDEEPARKELFNSGLGDQSPELVQAREGLLRRAREQLHEVEELASRGERRYARGSDETVTWSLLGGTLMLASVTAPDQLQSSMEEVMGPQQRQQQSTSSCGAGTTGAQERDSYDVDSSQDSGHSGGGDSGGDGGGSSCSGGGCGSS
ncbi:hypothetical protein [Paenibacillus daejeonensis]|uniref:hypothetical protein n=1 Tax=Paenibacillus daejeonensis TaxID=135193 RepID=UPI00037717D8|nr:hypothetical protein [Paenibacillus daejeonensis]